MSELSFKCPHCEVDIEVDESLIGQEILCPACSNIITLTQPQNEKIELAGQQSQTADSDYDDMNEPPRLSHRSRHHTEDSGRDHYSFPPEGFCVDTKKTNAPNRSSYRFLQWGYVDTKKANALNSYCPWALFVFILGCLQVVSGVILLVLRIANESTESIIGAISLIFSSSFLFMSAWIVQQIHVTNELKRLQIKMLQTLIDQNKR